MKRPVRRLPWFLTAPLVWVSVLPAWWWLRRHEARILSLGRPLDDDEWHDAVSAGVRAPERIRVIVTSPLPTPGAALLKGLAKVTRFPLDPPLGMALGYGIYLDESVAENRSTFVHECVHVAQFETIGGRLKFLSRYLHECIGGSYWTSAMEAEANEMSAEICSHPL
ncbi:MAG: hypothetical protein KDM64_02560 [Verrucomicrobiae bacterium]|nr:hypothetical protein [Verrucomicrobiae bacterium]